MRTAGRSVPFLILAAWSLAAPAQELNFLWLKQSMGLEPTRLSGAAVLDVAMDGSDNIFVAGYFRSTIALDGARLAASETGAHLFIARYSPRGDLVWAKQASGGSGSADSIAIDTSGNVVVAGRLNGPGDFEGERIPDGPHVLVAKLASDGSLLWLRMFEGTEGEHAYNTAKAVTVDAADNIYVVGGLGGRLQIGPHSLAPAGWSEMYVCKLSGSGSVHWARQTRSRGRVAAITLGEAVATDADGNVYVAGAFNESVGFEEIGVTSASESGDPFASNDAFLAKYARDGSVVWVRQVAGAEGTDFSHGLAIDGSGNVYMAGEVSGTATFYPAAPTPGSGNHAFLAKYRPDGTLSWIRRTSGSDSIARAFEVAADPAGNAIIVGEFGGGTLSFDGTSTLATSGGKDVFAAKYDSAGGVMWAKQAGGPDEESAFSLAIASDNDAVLGGVFSGTARFDSFDGSATGAHELFIARLGQLPPPDRYESNESLDEIRPLAEPWLHEHWRCPEREAGCPNVLENFPASRQAEEYWRLESPRLSLRSATDRDFFRVRIPDPANLADSGHDDVRPRELRDPDLPPERRTPPEPLPECDVLERFERAPGRPRVPVRVSVSGKLVVTVIPAANSETSRAIDGTGESIRLYRGGAPDASLSIGPPLQKIVYCPRSIEGLRQLRFSVGERSGPRPLGATGGYDLQLEYAIDIVRGVPDWVRDLMAAAGVRALVPIPCPGGDLPGGRFPFCASEGLFRVDLRHPVGPRQPDCRADGPGCPDFLSLAWSKARGPLDLTILARPDMAFSLFDAQKKLVAEATPLEGRLQRDERKFLAAAGEQVVLRLAATALKDETYFLVVDGPPSRYSLHHKAARADQASLLEPQSPQRALEPRIAEQRNRDDVLQPHP